MTNVRGKKVLVQGLGHFGGGVGVSRWLCAQGAHVTVTDKEPAEKLKDSMAALAGLPVTFVLGEHRVSDFEGCELLVVNPAVDKVRNEYVQAAVRKGVPLTTEMNLFVERLREKGAFSIGITGSVGKSTTTTLIFEALTAAVVGTGRKVFLGGNIGKSLLLALDEITARDVVVLELSSFMLEDTPAVEWSPDIAVATNLFANHLDRHHTMEEYGAVKRNIFKFQARGAAGGVAILNGDHDVVRGWEKDARGRVVFYTTKGVEPLPLVIPGEHNQSNARAALAVLGALPFEVDLGAGRRAVENFAGLSHRLQLVHTHEIGGKKLKWFNDSKATSPDASITALKAFAPGTAVFIVGGYDKHIDMSEFEKLLAERAAGVIGIGQTGQAFVDHVSAYGKVSAGRVAYAGTLDAAAALAFAWAQGGGNGGAVEAVVLSPASASWGQFTNYEERGERFIALARACGRP